MHVVGRVAAWLFGVPLGLLLLLYIVLIFTPIPLPLVNSQVRNMVAEAMPEGSNIELGDMALALEGYVWPVIRFTPVTYTDEASGARVTMDALEVGFSPIRALVGQPGATVTVVRPYIQVSQDMFGPRLVTLEVVPDPAGGPATVRIIEGRDAFPEVGFSAEGVNVRGELPPSALPMRSDNDWLIYNLEAAEDGLAQVIEQANQGRFSRLVVKDASVDMNDAVYGYLRSFRHINIDVSPKPNGKVVEGKFDFDFGGSVMDGTVERVLQDDGQARIKMALNNLDLAAFAPVSDDPASGAGIVGVSAVSVDVGFDTAHKITDGQFDIDLTGMDLRAGGQLLPIASNIMHISWKPAEGEFRMDETQLSIAGSSLYLQGVFKLGLDELYGPVVNVSMQGRDVSIANELGVPEEPFSRVAFAGWSAPLYGATGVDQFIAEKADGAQLAARGRIDVLQRGMGFDMTIAGDGISADDLKRLWPPGLSDESRNWFVKHVVGGKLKTSSMRYSFPVGTLEPGPDGKEKPLPKNAIHIDIVGEGVQIVPVDGMSPITIDGETRFQMRDLSLEMSADGARIDTAKGAIAVANVGFTMASETPGESIMELSGDLSGGIPALVALAKEQQPDLLKSDDMPIDIEALDGKLSLSLVSTIVMEDGAEEPKSLDYAINGVVQDFNSTAPLDSHTIGNGQLSFVASQQGFRVAGQAAVDGLPADIVISGKLEENAPPPEILLSATLDASDLKKLGFDAGEFLTGEVKFVAKPMSDGSIQMAVDVKDAALTVKDIGLSKAKGVPGSLQAAIKQNGDVTEISQVDIAFGDVKLQGSIAFDAKAGQLQSAEFTNFALSPGDEAQLSLTPIRGGYQVRLRGDQLDFKPMVKRFFDLGQGSTGGPQVSAFDDTTIALDVELKRALGFYKTTAFNFDLDLALRGTDLQRVGLQANFANESSISVTTNPTPDGKVLTVAFNDLGTVLRLLNVYPNIQGGQGSLVMETVNDEKADHGRLVLKNFVIVDEANLTALMEGQRQGSRSGNMAFQSGELQFVRRKDRVEVTDAVLAGDSIGGTARGFIYTDSRQYDLSGTFVPAFGLNNVMGKLLGPLAGRDGEGLFGITFQVKGPLDKPDFRVNPMSALAPGAFRRMFEYRQREMPRVE